MYNDAEVQGMSSVVDEVVLPAVIGAAIGSVAVMAMGGVAVAAAGVGKAVDVTAQLGQDFGTGVTEVLKEMGQEQQERFRLEQEWITKIRSDRDRAFEKMNAYISHFSVLSEADQHLVDEMNQVPGGMEQVRSLLAKRDTRTAQIRKLRDLAMKSTDADEIQSYAEQAEKLYSGLPGEIQQELVFLAQNGVRLPEYGTSSDDAIQMALARKHDVSAIRLQVMRTEQSSVTEAMIHQDLMVFYDSLAELMCTDGLNDRQARDILAIRQELKRIEADTGISAELRSKKIATLYNTFDHRRQAIDADLQEMRKYYEQYLQETYDVPEIRREMADFNSIDEIAAASGEARTQRLERLKVQYVQKQVDRVMKKNGLNLVDSAIMGRKEDDKRVVYGIDDKTAVDVFVSEKGTVATRIVGVNFGAKPSEAEEEALSARGHKFCSKMRQIEDDLEDVGVVLRRKQTLPPDRQYNTWIQIQNSMQETKKETTRKRKRQTNNKVMYME